MSDKTIPDTEKTPQLFVRPAEGNADRILKELEARSQKNLPQTVPPTPVPVAEPPEGAAPPDMAPPVPAAQMRRRHWGLIVSFLIVVVVPLLVTAWYLWAVAEDQYGSITGFTVRQDEGQGASDLLGGLAALTGGNAAGDSEILYEFIQSQALIRRIDADLDIRGHYSTFWEADPVFALRPGASIEDLEDYWGRIVRVSHDQGAGLLEVRVRAFDPDMARAIATDIVARSQDMINDLNAQAREDAMRFAMSDLEDAVARLSVARAALTSFRTRNQIVDPEVDIQGRMGVMNNLQQQLAQSLIELDLLAGTASPSDPRLLQAQRRIDVIQERLVREREDVAQGATVTGQDYPSLIAEFEGLLVEREFTEQNYRAALAAMDIARDAVARQSRYLATYIRPTLAETAEYPRRDVILGLVALFTLLSWAVGCLIFYSIRDRG